MYIITSLKRLLNIGIQHATNLTEEKRVYLVNFTTVSTIFSFLGIILLGCFFDEKLIKLTSLIGYTIQTTILLTVIYLQYKGKLFWAKFLLISSSLITCHVFNVYITPNVSAEFFFIIPVLMSLYLFNSKLIPTLFLIIAIILFFDFFNFKDGFNPEKSHFLILFIIQYLMIYYLVETNKKAEQTLNKQKIELNELNKFQNHLFVNISHELRTPLTLIKGQTNSLLRETKNSSSIEKIKKLDSHVVAIESLVNDIIDIAKLESNTLVLHKKISSINALAQKAYLSFEALFAKKEINFSIELSKEDYFINTDTLYLDRVFGNILVNALKYSNIGDKVAVCVEKKQNTIQVSISDTGIGVKESELETIFKRYYQSNNDINKAGGSGIGLAFSKEIIELHGGTINAHININKGLTITISLPIVQEAIVTIQNNPKKEKILNYNRNISSNKKILIVDDNEEMRDYLKSILNGYIIYEAENGQKALEFIENNTIDALVTDFMMPVMDGEALVKKIKKLKLNIPTIVLTARADVKSKLNMLQLGVDDYLTKPFIEDELLYRLQNIIFNEEERQNFITKNKEELKPQATHAIVLQAKKIILENISNAYFGVAQLSDHLKISERTLYRILKKETGLNSNLFIREIKLNTVRNQIEQNNTLTLQELAISVGLTNGSYLNQLYKEHFGKAIHE